MDDYSHPFNGVHFLHNIPSSHEEISVVRRKFHNIYRKAVHAGKWQNFAAGIGTGAAYATLHGLHWHPHWITIIEYVRHSESFNRAFMSYCRLILFFINVAIFSVNLILLIINTLCMSPLLVKSLRSHLTVSTPEKGLNSAEINGPFNASVCTPPRPQLWYNMYRCDVVRS